MASLLVLGYPTVKVEIWGMMRTGNHGVILLLSKEECILAQSCLL